jgi:hypothetical protein
MSCGKEAKTQTTLQNQEEEYYSPGIWKCNVYGFLLFTDVTSKHSPFLSIVILSLSSFPVGSFSSTITLFWP